MDAAARDGDIAATRSTRRACGAAEALPIMTLRKCDASNISTRMLHEKSEADRSKFFRTLEHGAVTSTVDHHIFGTGDASMEEFRSRRQRCTVLRSHRYKGGRTNHAQTIAYVMTDTGLALRLDALGSDGMRIGLGARDEELDAVRPFIEELRTEKAHETGAQIDHWVILGDHPLTNLDPLPEMGIGLRCFPGRMQREAGNATGVSRGQLHARRSAQRESTKVRTLDAERVHQAQNVSCQLPWREGCVGNAAAATAADIDQNYMEESGIRFELLQPSARILAKAGHKHERFALAMLLVVDIHPT